MTENTEIGKIAIIGPGQMTVKTPEKAATMPCPLSRTFKESNGYCKGPTCPLWRWRGLVATDPRFTSAIQRYIATRRQELLSEGVSKDKLPSEALLVKEATAVVSANPLDHHVPDQPEQGFCGLGGAVS